MLPTLLVRTVVGGAIAVVVSHIAVNWPAQAGERKAVSMVSSSIRAVATTPNGRRVADTNPLGGNIELAVTAVGFTPGSLVSVREEGASSRQWERADSSGTVSFGYLTPAATGPHRLLMQSDVTPAATGQTNSGPNVAVSVAPFAILVFDS